MYFAKNMGIHVSNEYSQKPLHSAKTSTADAIKTASEGTVPKSPGTTGDLIGNKIANKITSASKSFEKLHSQNNLYETDLTKERYISPER